MKMNAAVMHDREKQLRIAAEAAGGVFACHPDDGQEKPVVATQQVEAPAPVQIHGGLPAFLTPRTA